LFGYPTNLGLEKVEIQIQKVLLIIVMWNLKNHFMYNLNMLIPAPKSQWYKLWQWFSSNASHSIHIPTYLVAYCTFIKDKSWNKSKTNFNKFNFELNTLGYIQQKLWDVDVDLRQEHYKQ